MKRNVFRFGHRFGVIAASAVLAACATTGPAPVDDLTGGSTRTAPAPARATSAAGSYRVQRGDTLYSIAFRNGVDYRDLASWNNVGSPYTIYVGQELRLGSAQRASTVAAPAPAATAVSAGSTSVATTTAPVAKPAAPSVAQPTPFEDVDATSVSTASTAPAPANVVAPTGSPGAIVPAATANPVVATVPPPTPVSLPPPAPAPAPVAPPPTTAVASGEVAWRWPADGQLVGTYRAGDQLRQGIDIAGRAGDPVRAAAAGTVVYSGNGLIGYGELIIVKHSPAFLSAYGHNRKRLVKEGDRVTSGQTIAEMGSSSASRDSLHFEIRRNGKPVNPADYLPRR